jgi:signal transduction histidine kinase
LGQPLSSVIQDEAFKDLIAPINAKEVSSISSEEITVEHPKQALFSVSIVPVQDEERQISAYIVIIADLTEKRLKELERQKREKLVSLATLTAGVAHEIKNPLNSLNIHAQILKKVIKRCPAQSIPEFEQIQRSIEVIIEETNRLGRTVDQFTLAVRPTKPQLALGNVNKIIKDITKLMEGELEEKKIRVNLSLAPDVPAMQLDELRIRQAFLIIMKNSIEAIEEPGGEISISSTLVEDRVKIMFEDNGCGIKREEMDKVFEPYYSTKFYGTGLGLMIVYRIIHEHKGRISIESEPGEGTSVEIYLPLTRRPVKLLEEKTKQKE